MPSEQTHANPTQGPDASARVDRAAEASRASTPAPSVEAEIDLGAYLLALHRYWKALAFTAILGGLVGFASASLAPQVYEATATLQVQTPQGQNDSEVPPSVRVLLTGNAFAADVVREAGLDTPPHNVTPQSFVEHVLVIDVIPGTSLFRAKVRLRDPARAASTANTFAENAVDLSRHLIAEQTARASDRLKRQLDEALKRLETADRTVLDFRGRAQIELLRSDVDALLDRRGAAISVSAEIERERARLQMAERELAKRERVLTLRAPAAAEPRAADSARATSEVIDPGYAALDVQIADSRTRLAALEKERERLAELAKTSQLKPLRELYAREAELARLEADRDVLRRVHADLAERYEKTQAESTGGGTSLRVVDPAVVPDQPLSRGRFAKAAAGTLAGLLLAVVLVSLRDLIRSRTPRR